MKRRRSEGARGTYNERQHEIPKQKLCACQPPKVGPRTSISAGLVLYASRITRVMQRVSSEGLAATKPGPSIGSHMKRSNGGPELSLLLLSLGFLAIQVVFFPKPKRVSARARYSDEFWCHEIVQSFHHSGGDGVMNDMMSDVSQKLYHDSNTVWPQSNGPTGHGEIGGEEQYLQGKCENEAAYEETCASGVNLDLKLTVHGHRAIRGATRRRC
ncbi:hypothetical protein EDD15DRAFT_2194262 [Pisolithus albus]|nr:hypothetical protein EDD15DRAFT_2194262 [Pisolithus albus]